MTRSPLASPLLATLSLASITACAAPERQPATLFEGTGDHTFVVSTDDPRAQEYFDQGLALSYGFNHDEAVRSFEEVARLDPDCAMAYWGKAYALGPNMNIAVDEARAEEAARAVGRAMELRDGATEVERGLIEALAVRLGRPVVEDRALVDAAYSGAMRALWRAHPDHPDVGMLFADALVNETPWDLWSKDFEPNYNTLEMMTTLEAVLELDITHPGANHFTIHLWEPSGEPERAEAAADRLGALTPGLGHMVHMPSHIYIQVGRYEDSIRCNDEGARLDREYFATAGPQGVYHFYQAHNSHFRVWSALYMGAYEEALDACRVLLEDLPPPMRTSPMTSEWTGMAQTVHLRFGEWEAALAAPRPDDAQPYAVALWHYGRGLALANTGRFDEARAEAERLDGSRRMNPTWTPRSGSRGFSACRTSAVPPPSSAPCWSARSPRA